MPNKTTKKPTKSKQNLSHKQQKFILIFMAILIALGVVYWMTRNTSLKQVDKQELIAETQDMMDSIQLDGELVASELEDLGCSGRNAVGLAYYVHCDIGGYKYNLVSGDVAHVLRDADETLRADGWELLPADGYDLNLFNMTLEGKENSSLRYVRGGEYLFMGFYDDERFFSDYRIKEMVKGGMIASPYHGGVIYGIDVTRTYYSCRKSSIFTQPCPAPPSEPR